MILVKVIIHLLSGGMDSVVMLYDLVAQGHKVHCILFDYHQRHVQELQFARYHCHRLGVMFTVMEMPQFKGSELTDGTGGVVVPNRNAILLSMAVNVAIVANANTITYACNSDDEEVFADCRLGFVHSFNNLLRNTGFGIEVCAPFIDKRKWEIADLGRQLGVDMDQTWSCYRGGEKPCGECPACKKREEALSHDRAA